MKGTQTTERLIAGQGFIETVDRFGVLVPFDETVLAPPSPHEVVLYPEDGSVVISTSIKTIDS